MSSGNGLSRREVVASGAVGLAGLAGLKAIRHPPVLPVDKVPYVDGLSFVGQDSSRIADSGLTAFVIDVSSAEETKGPDGAPQFVRTFPACARSITAFRRSLLAGKLPGAFLATKGSEIDQAFREGRTAVFLQFQGCDPIGEDLERIDMFYELGLRVLQITHHFNNAIGGGALERSPVGLTKLGTEAVGRMHDLGVIPDVSHASDQTAIETARLSKARGKPAILSHGAARAIVNNARCAPDEVIRAIADSGGVMGIFMMSFWLTTDPTPTVDHLIKQLRHVANVGGIDAVGIANDYPLSGEASLVAAGNDNTVGVKGYWPWWEGIAKRGILGFDRRPEHVVIPELNNIRRMFTIHEALARAGFTTAEAAKIIGGNWIRVLKASLG